MIDSSVSRMRRAFLFAFGVLLVGQVTIIGAQFDLASQFNRAFQFDTFDVAPQLDLEPVEFVNRANEAFRTLLPRNILERFPDVNFNDSITANATKCSEQMEMLVDELTKGTMWALRMLDASSKLTPGILTGNIMDLGMYDECIGIKASDAAGEEIRGRHCMYKATVNMTDVPLNETLSICLPAVCEPEDIEMILNQIVDMIKLTINLEIPVTVTQVTCSSVEKAEWTAGGIATLVGFSLLLLFLVVSTICDVLLRYSRGHLSEDSRLASISKFSIYSSALRIMSTKTTPQTLPALQGLRFFSMCWVILGHEFFMIVFAPAINKADFLEWVASWDSLYIMIAPFAVDTFFTISGFLMSYLFLKEMSTGRRFNLFGYYIHRYLRLTPALGAMLLITIFIFPRIGSGALWDALTISASNSCRNNWWPTLLYVHNYVNKKDLLCLSHTWYLAVEMQFFAISPIILYPLSKKPKLGLTILGVFFIAAIVIPAKISYDNEYSSASWAMKNPAKTVETSSNFYMETHIRAAAWLIGIFFGYLVFTQKGSTRKITKWIGWILATAAFCFCIFSFRKFQDINYNKYEPVWETSYAAFSRPLWSVGVAWVIYASVRGFGGPVKTILSLSIFNPFSRISYCVYLVHYMILMMKVGSLRVPRYFTDFSMFNLFLSDFILCVVFGFLCSLLFESPVLILEKIVTNSRRGRSDESRKELQDEKVENGIDNPAEVKSMTTDFYTATHNRASAWLVGVFFGYILFMNIERPRIIMRLIGWLLATASFVFCVFGARYYQLEDYEYHVIWETFYTAVSRAAWSAAVAWILYACVRGFGGPVTKLLSLGIFHPFSRISYCTYLVHFVIQTMRISAIRLPRYFSDFMVINNFFSDFVLSVAVGFAFSLLFESPILILEKMVMKRGRAKTTDGPTKEERNNNEVENGIDNPGLTRDYVHTDNK